MRNYLLFVLVLLTTISDNIFPQYVYPKRELRGVWIATVANIDWPTNRNESSQKQMDELIAILDKLKAAGINTIFFQVRTECDALYKSNYEPWSYWLTGEQGKAPSPFFDPLAFIISEAHKRGMELHAWFNPYRAVKTVGEYKIANNHISITHPEWILDFKTYKMLNPGIPAVSDYIAKIIADVVRRYDVDGIHFDDYFYPYTPKITNEDIKTFKKYKGKFKDIDDWRRNNINHMVAEVYDTIQTINPRIKFGISPFGIVENKFAYTHGFESFKTIYCDPVNWLENKTVDYITPQLYWEIGNKAADYGSLLPWWSTVVNKRQIYVGIFSTKFAESAYKGSPNELEQQIRLSRQIINTYGTVFFSSKSITDNYSHFADSLKIYYKYPALIPTMPWKDSTPPLTPKNLNAKVGSNYIKLEWQKPDKASDGDTACKYVIYKFDNPQQVNLEDAWHILKVQNADETSFTDSTMKNGNNDVTYVVTALDRMNNESKPSIVTLHKN